MSSEENERFPKRSTAAELLKRLLTGQLPLERETTMFILVSALDIFMTWTLLYSGKFRESNPLANYFIGGWGIRGMVYFKMFMTAFVCVLSQIIAVRKPAYAEFVLKIGTVVVGFVVVYSLVLYLKHS